MADVEQAVAFQDDEKVYLTLTPGPDKKGNPAKFAATPTISSSDPAIVSVDQASPAPDGTAQSQSVDGVSAWLVGEAPGSADVTVPVELDHTPGVDQTVTLHCAIGGGASTGATVVIGDPVPQ